MSPPRLVAPGTTYLITQRCDDRRFLLKPSVIVNQVVLYLLAEAARRYGIDVHAYCVMSNHVHLVLTDRHARLPAFMQFLNAFVARAVNLALGRRGSFWQRETYSAVVLATPAAVVEKIAYTLANPVAAGLVRSGELWPGLWSAPEHLGAEAVEVRRPGVLFRRKGSMPEKASLELTVPSGFESAAALRDQVAAALADKEAQGARDCGGRFMGVSAVLAQKSTAKPSTPESRGALNPRVATRNKWKRIEVLNRLAEFVSAYREAWAAWTAGDRNVVFPYGTYELRVVHGVPCVGFG